LGRRRRCVDPTRSGGVIVRQAAERSPTNFRTEHLGVLVGIDLLDPLGLVP
jgi:hypothetical protein